jgi:hypothetical protein
MRKPRIVPESDAPALAHKVKVSAKGNLIASLREGTQMCKTEKMARRQNVRRATTQLNVLLQNGGASQNIRARLFSANRSSRSTLLEFST